MANRNTALDDDAARYLVAHSAARDIRRRRRCARRPARIRTPACRSAPEQGQFMALLVKLIGARRTHRDRRLHRLQRARGGAGAARRRPAARLRHQRRVHARSAGRSGQQAGVAAQDRPAARRRRSRRSTRGSPPARPGSYDFAFIDADKTGYDAYYERCLQLLRPGGLIAIDNMLWGGSVARPGRATPTPRALQALNDKLHARRARRHRAAADRRRPHAGAQALSAPAPRRSLRAAPRWRPSASWRAPRRPARARTRRACAGRELLAEEQHADRGGADRQEHGEDAGRRGRHVLRGRSSRARP